VSQFGLWTIFSVVVLILLAVDLGVLNRKVHVISLKEAARWTVVVVVTALAFNAWIFYEQGSQKGFEFLTGYVLELALSVDNVFVFLLILSYFNVPTQYHHRVLIWGIIGALILRGAAIAAGAILISTFHWITYVFGAFLVITGIRMAFHDEQDIEPESNPVLKLIRRFVPISGSYDGSKFFTKGADATGRVIWMATPLFVVLVMLDVTDLVFAVDSIPAIFGVTLDPYIVFTSNVFAICGLRSMYFLLAGIIDKFHFLKLGLAMVLTFVGVKMLLVFFHIELGVVLSLSVVSACLGISVVASMLFPEKAKEHTPVEPDTPEFDMGAAQREQEEAEEREESELDGRPRS
jgi:tellurite resistance protein TerC